MATPTHNCTLLHVQLINKGSRRKVLRIYGWCSFSKKLFFQNTKNGMALEYVKVNPMIYSPPEECIYLH